MDYVFFDEVWKRPYIIRGLIALSTILAFLLNLYGLLTGIAIVLPHLFYIPVILVSYYFPRRGVLFTIILSLLYCGMVITFGNPTSGDVIAAVARSVVFVIVAGIISYLSMRVHSDTQMCRRLVSVVQSSRDAIVGETLDGTVTDWNKGAEDLYGYSSEEMTGTSIYRIIPSDLAEENRNLLDRIRHGETINRYEAGRITKSGRMIQASLSLSPIKDMGGRIIGASVIAHDITSQKDAEKRIHESEEKFREIFNSINDAIHLHEVNEQGLPGRFIDVNNVACLMLQYSREELLKMSPLDFTIEYHSQPLEEIGHDLNTIGHAEFETGHRRRDGTIVPVEIHAHMITIPGRRMVVSVVRDITERKQDEEALRESEEKYRTLFDTMLEGFAYCRMVFDDDGNPADFIYLDVNAAFVRIVGIPAVTGKRATEVFPGIKDAYPELFRIYGRVASTGTPEIFDINFAPTKEWLHISVYSPARGYFVAVFEDITERKRAADALALSGKKLNLMSSITRHDILNQLTVLLGYLELSEKEENNPLLIDYLKREKKAAKTIQAQISFTRDYQDMGVKEPAWQDISEIVGYVAATIPMRNVKIDIDRTDLEIFADPLFERVFYNLIDNALRYGEGKLTLIRIYTDSAGKDLRIVIEDNGPGISPGDKPHLFTRGFGKHTGLGLFLSREILSITGMTIEETSAPGSGARFEIHVPDGMYRFSEGR